VHHITNKDELQCPHASGEVITGREGDMEEEEPPRGGRI
jgi:hypothetical protein